MDFSELRSRFKKTMEKAHLNLDLCCAFAHGSCRENFEEPFFRRSFNQCASSEIQYIYERAQVTACICERASDSWYLREREQSSGLRVAISILTVFEFLYCFAIYALSSYSWVSATRQAPILL